MTAYWSKRRGVVHCDRCTSELLVAMPVSMRVLLDTARVLRWYCGLRDLCPDCVRHDATAAARRRALRSSRTTHKPAE